MGAVTGVAVAIFGVLWTIFAFSLTRDSPFPMVGVIFPLFGLVFVALAIGMVIYNIRNAAGRNRNSIVEITTGEEEPDPLNEVFGAKSTLSQGSGSTVEEKLEKLAELRRKGVISDAEYQTQRERVLNSI
jgi:hypothetical protein